MGYLGYHGRVLHIDLTAHSSRAEEPPETFWRVYGGGGLLAAYYLMRESPAGRDPFGPENLLILTSSVVAGHHYAGLARFTAAGKSPLTGGIGETRCEGPFGIALKGSGADTLIFHGAADEPAVVLVERGKVTFYPAEDLWGRTVNETVDRLQHRFGPHVHTAVIGPAGERLVRFASIVTDRTHQAARMGLGAVMGAKRLKAVVIRGESRPAVADPAACQSLTDSYRQRMVHNPLTRWQLDPPGFSAWIHVHGLDTVLCTRNYTDSVFEGASHYEPAVFMRRYAGEATCPGCPNNCIKIFGTADNGTFDVRAGGIHQEITGSLGPNLGIADLDAIFKANVLCNDLGLDPTSLGFTLSMAMECIERGLLTEEAAGLPLRFGDAKAMLEMTRRIAYREGFGNLLGEGSRRAAARIGRGAERYALQVKGLEMVPFEPRTQTNLALGYAVAPIGPRYDICEHDWDFDTRVGWEHTLDSSRTLGILGRIPMDYLGPQKVRNYKALATLWSAADALDLCIFAIAPTRVFTLHEMVQLLAGVTGWNTSSYEIMRLGERRLHLMRCYNVREGLGASDDMLPDRFFEDPVPRGEWTGTRLDRQRFRDAIRTYYRMMGWDEEGRPSYETLLDHQLEWVVEEGHALWLSS